MIVVGFCVYLLVSVPWTGAVIVTDSFYLMLVVEALT